MTDPNVLDFSAPAEDAITIKFPDGTTTELPTMEQVNMETFQFLSSNGEEWYELFEAKTMNAKQRSRFDHLNNQLAYALCAEVPRKTVDTLTTKQKARMIVAFMSASPDLLKTVMEEAVTAATAEKA